MRDFEEFVEGHLIDFRERPGRTDRQDLRFLVRRGKHMAGPFRGKVWVGGGAACGVRTSGNGVSVGVPAAEPARTLERCSDRHGMIAVIDQVRG